MFWQRLAPGRSQSLRYSGRHVVVLIGLDGDTCQGGITLMSLGCAENRGPWRNRLEQLEQVDLAAGGGEGVKIKVMDMDPALLVRPALLGCQQYLS